MRGLRATWAVLKREVYAFFVSPMAYVLLTAWLLWCGMAFWMLSSYFASQPLGAQGQESPLTAFFGQTTLFYLPMLVFVPLVTMRLLAEERSRGTLELLLTAPVSEGAIVLGKYLASMLIWCAMWLPTWLYVWLTSRYGDVDVGAISASYVGVLGIGAYYMAIGLLMSALSRNQIVAAILTFLALGGLFVLGLGQYVFGEEYRELFAYVSVWGHMESFSRGVVDSRYLVFDATLAALGVCATILVLRGAVSPRTVAELREARGGGLRAKHLGFANVLLLLTLAFQLNFVSFRRYQRWDWTEADVYTLSDRTLAVLRELDQPAEVWILLSETEAGFTELRNLLGRYQAESELLTVHYVDPDRDPGGFREVAQRFELGAMIVGDTQLADVAALVVAGERHWDITRDDLLSQDFDALDDDNRITLNVEGERAITGALVELSTGRPTQVCVVRGHGEFQVAGGTRSLAGFAAEMRRENLELESIETRGASGVPGECDAVAVIGPEVAISDAEAELLRAYVRRGGNLLVALDPVPSPDQRSLVPLGIEAVLRDLGARVDRSIVIEPNPALLPAGGGHPIGPFAVVGWGEHEITAPFRSLGIPLLMSEARSIRPMTEGQGTVLLTGSEQSYAESNLGSLVDAPGTLAPDPEDIPGPVPLALAIETDVVGEEPASGGSAGRVVVIGDASLFASEFLQEPTVVNRSFASAVMGWLTQREALITIEPRTIEHRPVSMSQEDVGNLFLRVVVLIPLAFIFLGFAVWWNRRI